MVVTMYIDDCTYKRGTRTYRRLLLRESRRANGKVVKRTVANITDWPEVLREAIAGAVGPGRSGSVAEQVATAIGGQLVQGKSVGAVATVLGVARELGICAALGDDRQGRLALFQVVARVIDQGSRLSAVRMARSHAAAELIGLSGLDEGDLYENLSWLSTRQVLIESMLKRGTLQMERFDRQIAEVTDPGAGVRYILRRNPAQADRMEKRRVDQQRSWQSAMERANEHLEKHPKARPETAVRNLSARATRLKLSGWLSVEADGRKLRVSIDEQARVESARLDGCYVLQTDLPATAADARTVDARYHDLSKVEWAFRTAKTTHLEIRPIHLRRGDRTRAHALVVSLAYLIIRHLAGRWSGFDCTVEEGIGELAQLCSVQTALPDGTTLIEIPRPRPHLAKLLEAAAVQLPTLSHTPPPLVVTKRKLNTRRK
jgi:hypothetical protein